jgi:hypothetical protein
MFNSAEGLLALFDAKARADWVDAGVPQFVPRVTPSRRSARLDSTRRTASYFAGCAALHVPLSRGFDGTAHDDAYPVHP